MEQNNVILILLRHPKEVENKGTTFQWIMENAGILNRNRCRKVLTNMQSTGLIQEDPQNWKKGQKKWFSLTEKGKNKGAQLAVENINQGLSILEQLSIELNPEKVSEYIGSKITSAWDLMVKDEQPFKGKSFKEKGEDFMLKQAEPAKPIFEALRRLHKILTYFRTREVDCNQYVTIVRSNGSDPLTISLKLLEGINFVELFFLSHSKNNKELEIKWKPTVLQ
jgi:predicted transcriptional regulator